MRITLMLWPALALLLLTTCSGAPLPPALDLRGELQGPPGDGSVRGLTDDLQFKTFDGNYPPEWLADFALPRQALLNNGGRIQASPNGLHSVVFATGVLRGSRSQVLRTLLRGLEAPEKRAGKLQHPAPAEHFPRQWVSQVHYRTYTEEGALSIYIVDQLAARPGLCLFSIAIPRDNPLHAPR